MASTDQVESHGSAAHGFCRPATMPMILRTTSPIRDGS
jgi:hypothetical protein